MISRRFQGGSNRAGGRRRGVVRLVAEFALSMLILGALALGLRQWSGESVSSGGAQVRAIDGDSLTVDGRMIRLWGIDAPEFQQGCIGPAGTRACGREARARLAELVRGREVDCEGFGTDRYDRLLAICRAGGVEINATLVREGHAYDFGGYPAEEAEARASGRGVWAGDNERPRAYRERTKAAMESEAGLLDRLHHAVSRWLAEWRRE